MTRIAVTPLGTRPVGDAWPDEVEVARKERVVVILENGLARARRHVVHRFKPGRVVYANGEGEVRRMYG